MTAVMSPVGVGMVFFNASALINSGGKIYTYAAGTTTLTATYTDNTLVTPNANPIVLNAAGVAANEIWWNSGSNFKFKITDSADSTLQTLDNLVGINDTTTSAQSEWQALNLTPTYVSATSFTVTGNQTSTLTVGRRVKTTNTGGTAYSTILSSTFGALTTVVVYNDSTTLDAGLSAVSYGLLSATNTSVPLNREIESAIVARQNAAVAFSNTVAQSTLLSTSIPGAILSSARSIRYEYFGDIFNNIGGGPACTFRWRLSYGGTVVYDSDTVSWAAGASSRAWRLHGLLSLHGATNSQIASTTMMTAALTTTAGVGSKTTADFVETANGTAAIDSTANQTLLLTITMGTADANASINLQTAIISVV